MKKLFLGGNDYWLRHRMQTDDGTPATGLVLNGWLSQTKGGVEIHADLKKLLVDAGVDGAFQVYEAQIPPTALTTHLTTFAGKVIYDRVQGTTYDDHEEVLVVAARPAGE